MSSESTDLNTAISQCFAAFDEEFKVTFSRLYASSLNAISVSLRKGTPEVLGDVDAALPPLNKTEKPKGDPAKSKKKSGAVQPRLPINGDLYYKGEVVKPEKANSTLAEALKNALTHEKVKVHIQDWGIYDMDVVPHVFFQVCAALGDFEAITFKTIDDFTALQEMMSKPDVRTQDGHRPKKVALSANLHALERATLSQKPLKDKASRFDCVCRKKTGLEQPHPQLHLGDSDPSAPSCVTKNSVVSVGAAFNSRACESSPSPAMKSESAFGPGAVAAEKDKKKNGKSNHGKKSKSSADEKPKRDAALKRAAIQKLQIGNRTIPVWSAPQPNCHCPCPYCCWGEAAAEVLGAKLYSYLAALCEHCYTEQLVHWLGFDLSSATLVSFTHEVPGYISLAAVAAEALRTLYAKTVTDSNAAAMVPAFTNLWQTAVFFSTPDEGLTRWTVAELIRARMTRSVGDTKNAKRLPDPDGRLFQEWLPGAPPLRTLNKDQLKARESAKAALMDLVKPQAQKHIEEINDAFNGFLEKYPPSQPAVEQFFDPLCTRLSNDVISQCLDGGVNDAMQCLTKIVCALLDKHVLTRSVMEPLANVDSQLNKFVDDSLQDSSKPLDPDFVNGRRSLVVATLTGTRYVVSSTIASSANSFATDMMEMFKGSKEQLKALTAEGEAEIIATLSFIPTLLRAVMHVILSEAPFSFMTELSSYIVSVNQAPSSSYKSATTKQKEALAKKWQNLRQSLCAVSWRAGYLLEKSLLAQYVQQLALLKGASVSAKGRRPDPTVPSDQEGSGKKKGKKKAAAEEAAAAESKNEDNLLAAAHPYLLGFELDGVKKHLRELSETSAAAYWNAVLSFVEFLDVAIKKSHQKGLDRITPKDWKTFVLQSMHSAFESSYARMKAHFCTIASDMLVQFICDVISRKIVCNNICKKEDCTKLLNEVCSANPDMSKSIQIGATVDSIMSQMLKATVSGIVNEWKEKATDHYHIVSETISQAITYQASEKLADSGEALDTRSLSAVGSSGYSGSGSFTSDDNEEEAPVASVHSASGSKSTSHYSSISGSRSRSVSRSGSRSGSSSGSRSRSGSGSRSGSVSGSGSRSGSSSGSRSGSASGSRSGSVSGSKSGSASSKSGSASGSKSSSSHSSKASSVAEENTESEKSEIVPFDRM